MQAPRLSFERRLLLATFAAVFPGGIAALALLWSGDYTPRLRWTVTAILVITWLIFATSLRERVVRPLQTISNLLSAIREEDFSIRARGARGNDALGEVLVEVNALAETLRQERLGALEATALLRKVMAEIDVAVFTFDDEGRLRLANRAAEKLLAQEEPRLLGRRAEELGLAAMLELDTPRVVESAFPGGSGRWEVRRTAFRQGGLPHQLLVLADVSRSLREEERQAWQRLLRVLGHELNNTLTPVQSIAGSLERLLSRRDLPEDWKDDMRRGLSIISTRAESLSRFTGAYAKLARLPRPRLAPVELAPLAARVAALETRLTVRVGGEGRLLLWADADQLEQVLINLVRNAADASLETAGGVELTWSSDGPGAREVEIRVRDEGPGLSSTSNLFVPFFTTKPGGSGIGLLVSRQIAEAHGGQLVLENRPDRTGAQARLTLPLASAKSFSQRAGA
jgi:nitrogen fixation/metabolism regulation signal transduction histidine kinase